MFASLHGTGDFYLVGLYLGLEVGIDALRVKDMVALEDAKEGAIYLRAADGAFPPLGLGLLRLFLALSLLFLHELVKGDFILFVILFNPLLLLPLIVDVPSVCHHFS